MKKKSVLSVLALSFVLCLCSCSGSTETKTESLAYTAIDISSTPVADNDFWELRDSSSDYSIKNIGNINEIPTISTNPAIKDKELETYFLVQNNSINSVTISIYIAENNNINESVFDYHSDTCTFKVKMTDTNGILSELEGIALSNSPIVLIRKTDCVRKVIDALHQNGKLFFELIDTEYPASTYSFSDSV